MKNITSHSAIELGQKIQTGEISVVEAVAATIETIEKKDKIYNCYITVNEDYALTKAEEIQSKIRQGHIMGPLAGVPFAIKDNICVEDRLTTCGSKMLANYIAPYSATVIHNLEKAGAIIIGKTNMDEFAMGCSTETSAYGVTKNPWNSQYVAGGSSGGTAAAIANGSCFFGLGSDTGGSIRQPAAMCGVVGIKPTYGTVSRFGLVAYASSFDQIGPMGKNVADCATILESLASFDSLDATSIKRESYDFTGGLVDDVKGLKVGVAVDYFADKLSDHSRKKIIKVAEVLKEKGAIVEEVQLGMTKYLAPTYYVIATAEASSNLARYDGIAYGHRATTYEGFQDMYYKSRAEGFGTEVKRRIMAGSFVLAKNYYEEYYQTALKSIILIKQSFQQAFSKYDVIITPVTIGSVPKIGEGSTDSITRYQEDICTVGANLAGIPAMSVPCGIDENGLPIGVQFMAGAFQEKKMIQAAFSYECGRGNWREKSLE